MVNDKTERTDSRAGVVLLSKDEGDEHFDDPTARSRTGSTVGLASTMRPSLPPEVKSNDAAVTMTDRIESSNCEGASPAVRKAVELTVVALIPAHNEEDCIATAIASLRRQSRPPDRVVVVADNCTDSTVDIALRAGAEVCATSGNRDKKAGALNFALSQIVLPGLAESDLVLVMDADSELTSTFIEDATRHLCADPRVGAVCASYRARRDGAGILHLLQSNEFTRFARITARRKGAALVLSGVATIVSAGVLNRVRLGRCFGLIPGPCRSASVYETTSATEDIELTHALMHLGYRPLAPKSCVAWTDTMTTWSALKHQRLRWQRGMLDSLRLYGFSRMTLPYISRLAGMYIGSLSIPLHLLAIALSFAFFGSVGYQVIWLCFLPLFMAERVWTVRWDGPRAMLLAALLIPELFYETYRAFVYWRAVAQWAKRTERVWVPT